jgi:hypothetical protein
VGCAASLKGGQAVSARRGNDASTRIRTGTLRTLPRIARNTGGTLQMGHGPDDDGWLEPGAIQPASCGRYY